MFTRGRIEVSALLEWAGWGHLAQAQALATVYVERRSQEAWEAHRLLPVLAGLVELEPWLHQWYAEKREGYPGSPAQFYTDFINQERSTLSSDRAAAARRPRPALTPGRVMTT